MITKKQSCGNKKKRSKKKHSRLYIFTSADPIKFTRLDTYESDHYPIQLEINTLNSKKSPKMIKKLWRITTDNNITAAILEHKNWPLQSIINIKQILYKEIYIRPTVKLQQKANMIFKDTTDWKKRLTLKQHAQKASGSSSKILTYTDGQIHLNFIRWSMH